MATIIHEQAETEVAAQADAGALWLDNNALERATGFVLKSEGFCRGPVCVPVPAARRDALIKGERIDLIGLWHHMGHPHAASGDGAIHVLGTAAGARRSALESIEAPDFELPDLVGRRTRLSEQRGHKVLVVSWASW